MTIVADTYRFVVGVDTHVATHHYAVVDTNTGGVVGDAEFPTHAKGLIELILTRDGHHVVTVARRHGRG